MVRSSFWEESWKNHLQLPLDFSLMRVKTPSVPMHYWILLAFSMFCDASLKSHKMIRWNMQRGIATKSGSSSLPSLLIASERVNRIPPKLQHTGMLVTKQISGRSGLLWRPRLSKRPKLFGIRWVFHGLSRFTMVYHLSHWTTEHLTFSK